MYNKDSLSKEKKKTNHFTWNHSPDMFHHREGNKSVKVSKESTVLQTMLM